MELLFFVYFLGMPMSFVILSWRFLLNLKERNETMDILDYIVQPIWIAGLSLLWLPLFLILVGLSIFEYYKQPAT